MPSGIIATINNTQYQIGGESQDVGFDAVLRSLKIYNSNGELTTNTLTAVSGSFSDCIDKIDNGQVLKIVYYSITDNTDYNNGICTRQVLWANKYSTDENGAYLEIYFSNSDFEYIYWNTSTLRIESSLIKYLSGTTTEWKNSTCDTIGCDTFYNMTTLTSVTTAATKIEAAAFYGCSNLNYLYLTSSTVCALDNTSAFAGVPIAAGLGIIYVPDNLVSTYKSATNWSMFADAIHSINDYPVTSFDTISDTWAEIIANVTNGTYSTKYNIGDTKLLSINNKDVYMQIAAFDTDTLASGSGAAAITWIAKGFAETHGMNASNDTTGGWASSEMRSWLSGTVLPTIDSTVRNAMKAVTKTYYDYGTTSTLSTSDTLWIPSLYEVNYSATPIEGSGVKYSALFTNNNVSRIKYNTSNKSASYWWLRSAYNSTNFRTINTSGAASSPNSASYSNGVVFGFCI